jgi:septal ring factor EnvC (AmiA/AmiB activator)
LTARALTVACLCFLLGPGTGPALGAAPSAAEAREELGQLKSRIEAVQKRLAQSEESRSEAADALRRSERAISEANRSLAALAEKSRAINAQLTELKREAERVDERLKGQQASLEGLLYERYVAGRPETLGILLSGRDPNTVFRDLHYLTYVARARAELVGDLRQTLARAREVARLVEKQSLELKAIAVQQLAQRQQLEQEKRERSRVLARLSREIGEQKREIGSLRRDEARLTRLIEQLARAIARTPKPRATAPPTLALRNERLPEPIREPTPFQQLKGRLALPVRGELGNRFGSPRQDGGVVWKGLFIAAPPGTEVRAIAAGRVVFADWLRGFGNLLIIDHGDSYMTLYGYNETLFREVGDVIRGGDRVAAVGNSGGHPQSGLYFEMRHEGRPFDPLTWVSVR